MYGAPANPISGVAELATRGLDRLGDLTVVRIERAQHVEIRPGPDRVSDHRADACHDVEPTPTALSGTTMSRTRSPRPLRSGVPAAG